MPQLSLYFFGISIYIYIRSRLKYNICNHRKSQKQQQMPRINSIIANKKIQTIFLRLIFYYLYFFFLKLKHYLEKKHIIYFTGKKERKLSN